jgi:hypothetical protein
MFLGVRLLYKYLVESITRLTIFLLGPLCGKIVR